jgi:hypothetical protein
MIENRPYNEIFYEKIPFRLMLIFVSVFGIVCLVFLGLFVYQYTGNGVIDDELPSWFFLGFAVYMALIAMLMASFREMKISLTYESITVSFGWMRKTVPWTNIEGYYQENGTGLNGGIHIGLGTKGKLRMSYAVIGKKKIVLNLKTGKIREFEFSTTNPDVIMQTIKKQTGKEADKKSSPDLRKT